VGNWIVNSATNKAISFFSLSLSVLRQFKIVKLPRQPGKKLNKLKKNCLCMLYGHQTYQTLDVFHFSAKEILNKV
jgi:hypothetical protein